MIQVNASGNLGREPEMQFTANSLAITKVSIAIGQFKKKGVDQPPIWLNLVLFGKQAENFSEWLHKGDQVFITGKLVEDHYRDQNGEAKKSQFVEVKEFEIIKRAQPVGVASGNGSKYDDIDDLGDHPF